MRENRFGATHNQLHRYDRENEPRCRTLRVLDVLLTAAPVSSARAFSSRPQCPAFEFPGFPFLRFFIAHGRGLLSCRALDNIERLIPFPRQQSNAAWRPIAAPRNRPATGDPRRQGRISAWTYPTCEVSPGRALG